MIIQLTKSVQYYHSSQDQYSYLIINQEESIFYVFFLHISMTVLKKWKKQNDTAMHA